MIELFLVISCIINIIFLFYCRWLIGILKAKEDDINILADNLAEYVSHVKAIHEMEMFYGDQTLKGLIEHGTQIIEKVEEFDFIVNQIDTEEPNNNEP